MSKIASSEEMNYNENVVRGAATSTSNNNSSGYGKSLAQQNTETVTNGVNNTIRAIKGCKN